MSVSFRALGHCHADAEVRESVGEPHDGVAVLSFEEVIETLAGVHKADQTRDDIACHRRGPIEGEYQ